MLVLRTIKPHQPVEYFFSYVDFTEMSFPIIAQKIF